MSKAAHSNQKDHRSAIYIGLLHPAKLFLITLALTLVFANPYLPARLIPQAELTARIEGTVLDATGAVIPGVLVRLIADSTQVMQQTLTDMSGLFVFENLPVGKYTLTCELAGFKQSRLSLELKAREEKRLRVVLEVGQISTEVTVSSALAGRGVGYAQMSIGPARPDRDYYHSAPSNTESYDRIKGNEFIRVREDPRSTFSIDVDTASYSNVRRFLQQGILPPKDAVRIEELINYFSYDFPEPQGVDPFEVVVESTSAPWNREHRLVSIGIQGRIVDLNDQPPSNFVFLIDVSGSMGSPDKLPMLRRGLRFLVEQLRPADEMAIVVYAGSAGMVLPPTSGRNKTRIVKALEELEAGGSTNGGQGIRLAYKLASENYLKEGNNRVILATDGDFNVGVTNQGDLTRLIEEEASKGVYLTVLGFGTGNLKDSTMEKLAQHGNGNYSYIDSLLEARKVLVEEMGSTLLTIAKDVKIQVEFNPLQVESFRLIGYENRLLEHRDFDDDRKDAGEIGAGHSLTVLYEIIPVGSESKGTSSGPLRYQTQTDPSGEAFSGETLYLQIRYKNPEEAESRLIQAPVIDSGGEFRDASDDLRFAASVAAFGMLLRDSPRRGETDYDSVLKWAKSSLGRDAGGYRSEFLDLIERARRFSLAESKRGSKRN